MESDGCSPLRIFPQAAITSDFFISILSGAGPEGDRRNNPAAGNPPKGVIFRQGEKPNGRASEKAPSMASALLSGVQLKMSAQDWRRRVCSPVQRKHPEACSDGFGDETGGALSKRLKTCREERYGRREIRRLLVRTGNFERSVIRPGRRRVGHSVDGCQHDK
jgi:hypothetical protein